MKLLSLKSTGALSLALIVSGVMATTPVAATQQSPTETEGKVAFTAGELTLDQVPNFDFDTHMISGRDETYNIKEEAQAQVTDLRGSSAGWRLTVTQDDQLKTGDYYLPGAQITLKAGTVLNTNDEQPTARDVVLIPKSAATVLIADKDKGNGVSTLNWSTSQATLSVPGTTTKRATEYKTTLTWTLADAPTVS